MLKNILFPTITLASAVWLAPVQALDVLITPDLESVEAIHQGQTITIQRNQDPTNRLDEYYTYTSRKCPPFCIQPMVVAPGVQTVGELEVLDYLKRIANGDQDILVVDARTRQWPKRGMIPGAINVPWTTVDPDQANPQAVGAILQNTFGARYREGAWDYSPAKTLVLYCNGPWCSQSHRLVISLLRYGYPAGKLKWYRGGMQGWNSMGLTTVKATP